MSSENDKELDHYFKKLLEGSVDSNQYNEEDWLELEMMLNNKNGRVGYIYWLPVIAGIAAVLIMIFGWFSLNLNESVTIKKYSNLKNEKQNELYTGTSGGSIRHQFKHVQVKLPTSNFYKKDNLYKTGKSHKSFLPLSADSSHRDVTGPDMIQMENEKSIKENLLASSVYPVFNFQTIEKSIVLINISNTIKKAKNTAIKTNNMLRPTFAMTVLAAPDINGVNSFQQSKVGSNFGLMFSINNLKKFSISAGVVYSNKPYEISFADYHTAYHFSQDPSSIYAVCKMLDIPINIDYQVYHKRANILSVGTGLSSYLMLNENYSFDYSNPYLTGPSSYKVPHSKNYLFDVFNLNVTYQRQLSGQLGFIVQPYLKIPLTNLGYGQVRLQTTGVAFGLTWNLNSLSRPN